MIPVDRTPNEWFVEAARCYVERHQGCPWCGGSHRVYHITRAHFVEYTCNACDFRAGFNRTANSFFAFPGEENSAKHQDTMHEH
jgi:transposase-like protein